MISIKRISGLLFGPLLFILIQFISINDLSTEGKYVLGTASWMAIWWVLEVVDIAVTSLLPIVIFPLTSNTYNKVKIILLSYHVNTTYSRCYPYT